MDSLANRHNEALREWRRWRTARFRREREKALFELWQLCDPEVWRAVKTLAAKLSESRGTPGSISVPAWLWMHGMTEEEARVQAFPGVWRAAERFDPEKGTFQTYASRFILAEIRAHLRARRPLAQREARDPEPSYGDERALLYAGLLRRVRDLQPGTTFEHVLEETASLSSEALDDLVQDLAELDSDPALETLRAALVAQSVRAADREDRMAKVSDLAKMLRAKKWRKHMKKKYHSNVRLGREFGVSDNTVVTWLNACEEQGVAPDDLSPEALDRLARIMNPRRGPKAGPKPGSPRK